VNGRTVKGGVVNVSRYPEKVIAVALPPTDVLRAPESPSTGSLGSFRVYVLLLRVIDDLEHLVTTVLLIRQDSCFLFTKVPFVLTVCLI
jgi:hypothetical protein